MSRAPEQNSDLIKHLFNRKPCNQTCSVKVVSQKEDNPNQY